MWRSGGVEMQGVWWRPARAVACLPPPLLYCQHQLSFRPPETSERTGNGGWVGARGSVAEECQDYRHPWFIWFSLSPFRQ